MDLSFGVQFLGKTFIRNTGEYGTSHRRTENHNGLKSLLKSAVSALSPDVARGFEEATQNRDAESSRDMIFSCIAIFGSGSFELVFCPRACVLRLLLRRVLKLPTENLHCFVQTEVVEPGVTSPATPWCHTWYTDHQQQGQTQDPGGPGASPHPGSSPANKRHLRNGRSPG